MAFEPQYGLWSTDDLLNQSGAIFLDPGEFEILDGVTKLIPTTYSQGTFSFNAPWDPVTGWGIENNMDDVPTVIEDFAIYTGGLNHGINTTGSYAWQYGNIGSNYYTSFFTSGDKMAFIYDLGVTGMPTNFTIEVDVRTKGTEGRLGATGQTHHGIYFGDRDKYAFIEVAPDGLVLHNISGAVLPGDFTNGLRRIRVVKAGDDIAVMSHYNEAILYANDAMTPYVSGGWAENDYIAFGAWNWRSGESWTGASTGVLPWGGTLHAHGGRADVHGTGYSQWGNFTGFTMWDDVKVALNQAVTVYPESYYPEYPQGLKTLYTAPWYPAENLSDYVGAFVKIIGINSGSSQLLNDGATTVEAEYLVPSGNSAGITEGHWTTAPEAIASKLTFTSSESATHFHNLAKIPKYSHPFQNALRYRIQARAAEGLSGNQVPAVDTITYIGAGAHHAGEIVPSWKLSSMPKDLTFGADTIEWENMVPPAHPQDLCYFHNENGTLHIPLHTHISPAIYGLPSGQVVSSGEHYDLGGQPTGLIVVEDGQYGPAWRNFGRVREYEGNWFTNNTYYVALSGGNYGGQALEVYQPYPSTGIGDGEVLFSIYEYTDFDGNTNKAQRVIVEGYNKDNLGGSHEKWAGLMMSGISVPTKGGAPHIQHGVIEGVIQIPRGPGVTVGMHEPGHVSHVLLKGEDYRSPRKFACGMRYREDHSNAAVGTLNGTHISMGVLPRENSPILDPGVESLYGPWFQDLQNESVDEFILFNITGYMCDHSWVIFSGENDFDWYDPQIDEGNLKRRNLGLGGVGNRLDGLYSETINSTGFTTGVAGDFYDLNTALINAGTDPSNIYYGVHRNSLLFEGWFRPYGIVGDDTNSEVDLVTIHDKASRGILPDDRTRHGMALKLTHDGRVRALVDTRIAGSAYGYTGDMYSGSAQTSITSQEYGVRWGDWNHIGVTMEVAAMGDGDHRSAYPSVPKPFHDRSILHGARTAKLYLTLNDRIVAQADIAGNSYSRTHIFHGDAVRAADLPTATETGAVGWPTYDAGIDTFPKLPEFYTDRDIEVKIGENVFCDFDHVRASIRDRADVLTDIFTMGSKTTQGLLSHRKAPKPFPLISSGISHCEMAHIYRFDSSFPAYTAFDDGYAPGHAIYRGQDSITSSTSELHGYGVQADFFTDNVEGPDDRLALRIGPGSRVEMPYHSFDERLFNGTGSFDKDGNKVYNSAPRLLDYANRSAYAYYRTSSNSHVRMSTRVRLNKLPTTGVMDILTLDESKTDGKYGLHQIYLGVNEDGYQSFGTRHNYTADFGPWTGDLMQTGVWYHIGLDAALREDVQHNPSDTAMISVYLNGYRRRHIDSLVCLAAGGSAKNQGRPFAYGGLLNTGNAGAIANKSVYRVGGDIPRNGTVYPAWTYRYGDYDVQDWIIGYALGDTGKAQNLRGSAVYERIEEDNSQWNWSGFYPFGVDVGGIEEVFVADGQIIGPISGGPFSGVGLYPATLFEDAGQQMVYFTANRGNDPEGLLQRGMSLYPPTPFMNAPSYYAIYENDNAADVIGTTDSPIQIGNTVPLEGINLALVNISPWVAQNTISSYDLSDSNFANITPKTRGDKFMNVTPRLDLKGLVALDGVNSEDIRVSSIPVYNTAGSIADMGYFMHLIGGSTKGVYLPSATTHEYAAESETIWWNNYNKLRNAISLKTADGINVPFAVMSWRLFPSPYGPEISVDDGNLGANLFGINTLDTTKQLDNFTYSVVLVASKQSIGRTIFIHYPSIDYKNNTITMQDKEIYNAVPLQKKVIDPVIVNSDDEYIYTAISGEWSAMLSPSNNNYDITIWHGSTGQYGLTTNNQDQL